MIVVIADIINSKSLLNRVQVQESLQQILNQINETFEEYLASKFTITLGDEFQGVLNHSNNLLHILDKITFPLLPVRFRFGIGIGALTTKLDPSICIGSDGPAFWKAREAIEYVHRNNDYGRANIHLSVEEPDDSVNLINQILKLTALQVSGWRDSQINVYKVILEEEIVDPEEINHQRIAEKLDILTSSLTRRFESSGIKRYMSACREVELALEKINKRYA
ncbi:MAG: hypothetical protein KBA05_02495 [Anaerolineaceae bacterium]|jgi:hypothetical protein|nr:hypothetical protein [Anaerolineaceae bacterium]MDI9530710.1 SatD family protein [Chloroflexota bacterium]